MKSKLFQIPKLSNHPIAVQYDYSEKRFGKFHYHKEVQLTFIKKGEGLMLCGTNSIRYKKNDLFIIGEKLPHVFIGDEDQLTESISIYFTENWLLNLYPESNYLQHFIKISKSGVKIANWKDLKLIEDTLNKGGLYRVTSFIGLIEKLSETNSTKILIDKEESIVAQNQSDSEKLNDVFRFISENIDKSIKLEDLANICNLTEPSFCRYFKQKTGKTVSNYISQLKAETACRLLQNEDLTVEEVGYKVGYNNFSNFLRQFKKVKNCTPKQYRKEMYNKMIFN